MALSADGRVYNYFTAICGGSEAGSGLGLIDFVHHSTPGLRVKKKQEEKERNGTVIWSRAF